MVVGLFVFLGRSLGVGLWGWLVFRLKVNLGKDRAFEFIEVLTVRLWAV